jgi:hypothetical protein
MTRLFAVRNSRLNARSRFGSIAASGASATKSTPECSRTSASARFEPEWRVMIGAEQECAAIVA